MDLFSSASVPLPEVDPAITGPGTDRNRLDNADRAAHDWYRFVLSFPPHLVRDYLLRFGIGPEQCVLDPFCGTGTTLVECKKIGISSVGIEASPMAHFASQVKINWRPDPDVLEAYARTVAAAVRTKFKNEPPEALLPEQLRTLTLDSLRLLLTDSISPVPLHRVLVLQEKINHHRDDALTSHALLALAKVAVATASNLKFGPEVGVGPIKSDAPVLDAWLDNMAAMAGDLRRLCRLAQAPSAAIHADARAPGNLIAPASVDAVFTSPPYPNEKDYTRTTRLESVLLGFATDRRQLQSVKRTLLRSNTRNVYKEDDDDQWVAQFPVIQEIAETIERRRIEMEKTSGFERLYGRVTKLYFGGMARHLAGLRRVLKPGAHLAYVVGDQASYLQVMIRTGTILAESLYEN